MSRLLFAAARGARIQAFYPKLGWILSSPAALGASNDKRLFRIHPKDAHLQYGPISSALRRMAEDEGEIIFSDDDIFSDDEIPDWIVEVAKKCGIADLWRSSWFHQTPDERRLALCVMAEALADEGL